MSTHERRPVTWTETGDGWTPYEATVDGRRWELRFSGVAYGPDYRLLIDGTFVQDIPKWPSAWSRPLGALIAGPCPVGLDLYLVTGLSAASPVLLYCPDCQCVWPSLRASEGDPDQTLADYGLSEASIRHATEEEALAAGHQIAERVPARQFPLPMTTG